MATRIPALIQLSDPRVAAQLVVTISDSSLDGATVLRLRSLPRALATFKYLVLCYVKAASRILKD